ncbi:jerky protein homolog-like [Toxorhynchites rutilus septentrionalis]|uniref:jerky protein homolog-like n=1 Tax=Toxorhynchites rutilus septentrionalis TaxID=329112 RepID=UPI002479F6DA|nr:jerky protein homolog-like [Toxorhynchites rutilus septentrionalis]
MDGTLKLPLTIIGKSIKPRALRNVKVLPVYYRTSKNAWMTQSLFKELFFGQFVPHVSSFLKAKGLPIKAVLVLDNCSAPFSGDELKTEDGSIYTTFLPPKTTAVIQPMDQNIIRIIKIRYRNLMMRGGEFEENGRKINIKDAMYWVTQAWEQVPADARRKSWNMLYNPDEIEDEDDLPLSLLREKLVNIAERIETTDFIDEEDAEYETLEDDEIVAGIINPPQEEGNSYAGEDSTLPTVDVTSQSVSFGEDDEYSNVSDELC